jgi:hypothetical protein
MPATSKSQQRAAGIAHAAKIGKIKPSKLKGASKQMYKSMTNKDILHFASTKRRGLPEKVVEALLDERDDLELGKVNIPKAAKAYARITGKDVMTQPNGISNKYRKSMNCIKAVTGQEHIHDFVDMDKGEKS